MPEEKTAYQALKPKLRRFVDAYLGQCKGNALRSAEAAGYKQPQVLGSRLLRDPAIKAAIEERVASVGVEPQAVLHAVRDIAFGSIEDAIRILDNQGNWTLDLQKAQQNGSIRLIKKVGYTRNGPYVEMYSALDALQLLGKQLGIFKEKHEISGPGGGPIEIDLSRLSDADLDELERIQRKLAESRTDSSGATPAPAG
jgi:hypothetical protein